MKIQCEPVCAARTEKDDEEYGRQPHYNLILTHQF